MNLFEQRAKLDERIQESKPFKDIYSNETFKTAFKGAEDKLTYKWKHAKSTDEREEIFFTLQGMMKIVQEFKNKAEDYDAAIKKQSTIEE